MLGKPGFGPLALLALAVLASGAGAQCELDKLFASDTDYGDLFGQSVSVSGDTGLVGASSNDDACPGDLSCNSGSAYVFERQGAVWVETAKLTASDAAAGDRFGYAVSLWGDTALVGAYGDDDAGANSGAVYVLEKRGWAGMTETAKLIASDASADTEFGIAVSLSGNTALVGAAYRGSDTGAAYVFERDNATGLWVQTARFAGSDEFGLSVSVSGDTALVGAYGDDYVVPNSGAAYVFEKQDNAWFQTAKLKASDADVLDQFGFSVSVSGDTALVGAYGNDHAGSFSGAAYVFEKQGTVWVETAKLTASDAAASDEFGHSVSVSGDTALVGAHRDDDPGSPDIGSAYVFEKPAGGWVDMTETAKLTASTGLATDRFGTVSVSGQHALVGAWADDFAGAFSGTAYRFWLGACLSGPIPGVVAASNTMTVSEATPFGLVGLSFGLGVGGTHVGPPCPGLGLDIDNAVLLGTAVADVSGSAVIGGFVPAGLSGTTVYLQAVEMAACEVSHLVSHTFP